MIFLVGGASRSGKSVFARELAMQSGMSAVSTDHLVQGLQDIGVEMDSTDDGRAKTMWPFLRSLIARTLHSQQSLVLEGVHLLPEMVQEVVSTDSNVKGCFLGFPNSTPQQELGRVRQHPKYSGDWLADCTEDQALSYLESSISRSQRDEAECTKLNLAFFNIATGFEKTQQSALNFMLSKAQ